MNDKFGKPAKKSLAKDSTQKMADMQKRLIRGADIFDASAKQRRIQQAAEAARRLR